VTWQDFDCGVLACAHLFVTAMDAALR
jgi:hypothetical protein